MLINFKLKPLHEIQPWDTEGTLSLHWFGLTDGEYWIEVGDSTLFEYNKHVLLHGKPRYCDYPVVRLYEDLMEIVPYILEPIPSSLVRYISLETAGEWQEIYDRWYEDKVDDLESDEFWRIVSDATAWVGKRSLDSGYLTPSARIIIWSDAANVRVEWDNRDKFYRDQMAWSATQGQYLISRCEFIAEVHSFHVQLMKQMTQRVNDVLAGALSEEININKDWLRIEHEQRCSKWDDALRRIVETDWHAVERAINDVVTQSR
ncbi:MAG: DUF5984 family protein [Planctomycetota bacterium]|nr:DUF5984 family protein [Planctomycetota bacterium]MDA1212322.1 DUF5984 family protein [Planctomycetota bacterium]